MGEETRYYTKGDANQQEDDGYRKREDGAGESSLSGWSDSDIETAAREKSGDSDNRK